jgi:hypothetical protein
MDEEEDNCDHIFIKGVIDIDSDRSETIIYCDHCNKTIPL